MVKALSISPMITPLTLILLVTLVSCSYTIVAPSGGAMGGAMGGGGGGFSGDSFSGDCSFTAAISASSYKSNHTSGGNGGYENTYCDNKFSRKSIMIIIITIGVLALLAICHCCSECFPSQKEQQTKVQKTSVIKLQVALNGTAVSFQRDLNAIARVADTSKRSDYKYILEESAKALLRHADYWVSSYLSVDLKSNLQQATYVFNHFSREERSKFDRETLTNIDDCKRECIGTRATTFRNPFILVTILLQSTELLQLHPVNTTKDLEVTTEVHNYIPKRNCGCSCVMDSATGKRLFD